MAPSDDDALFAWLTKLVDKLLEAMQQIIDDILDKLGVVFD